MGRGIRRARRADAARSGRGRTDRLLLRRQRRRSSQHHARCGRRIGRRWARMRSCSTTRPRRPGLRANCMPRPAAQCSLCRCARFGRTGWCSQRDADGHVWRRRGAFRARPAGCDGVREGRDPDRRYRRRATRKDGQPTLHRRTGAGPVGGHQLRTCRRPRHEAGTAGHRQGRGSELADGQPWARR